MRANIVADGPDRIEAAFHARLQRHFAPLRRRAGIIGELKIWLRIQAIQSRHVARTRSPHALYIVPQDAAL